MFRSTRVTIFALCLIVAGLTAPTLPAQGTKDAGIDGFKPAFSGKDLAGWKGTNEQKAHWKIGEGVLICDGDGKHGETRIASENSFGDFDLCFDWQVPKEAKRLSNSRTILQLRGQGHVTWHWMEWPEVNSSCYVGKGPFGSSTVEMIKLNPAGQWNQVKIQAKGDLITVHFNGKRAFEGFKVAGIDARGPISFDSEGPVHFRNVVIRDVELNGGNEKAKNATFAGTLEKVRKDRLIVEVSDGTFARAIPIFLKNDTKIIDRGKAIAASDLKKGQTLSITVGPDQEAALIIEVTRPK